MPKRMYVFVREDMPVVQQIVQTGHACAEVGQAFGNQKDCHLILIGVKDEESLCTVLNYVARHGIRFKIFFEPDSWANSYTALATEPIEESMQFLFKQFNLWRVPIWKLALRHLKHTFMTVYKSFGHR